MDGPYAQGKQGQTSHLKTNCLTLLRAFSQYPLGLFGTPLNILRAFAGKHLTSESPFVVTLEVASVML